MNIFEFAMQMEKDGEDYYRQLASAADNSGLKTILAMMADEEVKHYSYLDKMQTEQPQIEEVTILADCKNIFALMKDSSETVSSQADQVELYKKAQEVEKENETFYREKANEVEQDYHKESFLLLAEEEKKHYFLLENIIDFVSRSQEWLENAEFCHLDDF